MVKDLNALDWSLIRSFLAVAETGSLSAAARRLGASQPTLGRQIRQLESELRQGLFHRQPRGFTLTPNGEASLEPARRMSDAVHQIALTATGRQTAMEGSVRITASDMMSMYVLPPVLADLTQDLPGIQIDLVSSDSTENLLFREADIALRMYQPQQLELIARKLCEVPLGLFGARQYLERAGHPATLEEALGHALIGYDRNEEIILGLQERGWPATRDWFALRCDSHPVNWALLRAGCGLGFAPEFLARRDPEIVRIDLVLDLPSLPLWLVTHQALRHTPRISAVWDALSEGLMRQLS